MSTNAADECCPRFDPAPWDEKEQVWDNKLFVKDHVISLFHIPLNFGAVMRRNVAAIEAADAKSPSMLVLSDEKSLWGADVYIEVTKEVPGTEMARISGTFLCKVFEGPYKDMGKWIKEMMAYVAARGMVLKKMYFYYTTCPKCANKYGKNYVVILAQQ